tara:strand:- start:83 stop:469 length:387 start_codon:yes stop_codon:yes gene_type:complete
MFGETGRKYISTEMREVKAIQQLRHIGLVEGTSTLLLFFVAMPLKYATGMPTAVSIVGMIHGILFTLYCVGLVRVSLVQKRSFGWSTIVFIAAIIPFGPFVLDRGLRREEETLRKSIDAKTFVPIKTG